jgi:hypothetical protein
LDNLLLDNLTENNSNSQANNYSSWATTGN